MNKAQSVGNNESKSHPQAASSPAPAGEVVVEDEIAQPPFTNRGVVNTEKIINISIHWLEITFFTTPKLPMNDFMSVYLPWHLEDDYNWESDFALRGTTDRFYKAIYDGPDGVVLRAYPTDGTHCSLQLSGSVIEKTGQDLVFRFLELIFTRFTDDRKYTGSLYHWHCTRIDIAFDGVPFTPAQCRDTWMQGNYRTRIHRNSYEWRTNAEGDSFYMGKRVSGRIIRIYDRRGPVRLELELKKKYALPFVRQIMLEGFQSLRSTSIGVLRDTIDFIDSNSDKNKSRAKLLPWWESFVGDEERIRYSRETRSDTASVEELKLLQFYNRMKPTLFMFKVILGQDLNKSASDAEIDLKPHHRSKILRLRPDYKFDD